MSHENVPRMFCVNFSPFCVYSCSFWVGGLQKVLANLRGWGKTLEITVPKSHKKD